MKRKEYNSQKEKKHEKFLDLKDNLTRFSKRRNQIENQIENQIKNIDQI
jgi:hypothetical protein